jgi:hypothetical protein
MRVTVACSQNIQLDAGNLAMVVAEGPADAATYENLNWQDENGHLYACASFPVRPEWLDLALGTLDRPAWDTEPHTVNMVGANRAQNAIVLWTGEGDVPQAAPGKLTAVVSMAPRDAIAAMGLTMLEEDL